MSRFRVAYAVAATVWCTVGTGCDIANSDVASPHALIDGIHSELDRRMEAATTAIAELEVTHAPPQAPRVATHAFAVGIDLDVESTAVDHSPEGRASTLSPPDPTLSTLNDRILGWTRWYPTDGSLPFRWEGPNTAEVAAGTTTSLYHEGELIAPSSSGPASTHCCGLTFEVTYRALHEATDGTFDGLTALDLYQLRLGFCGDWPVAGRERLAPAALEAKGFGVPVELEDARPGDIVQLWRSNGSGHSAVFLGWVHEEGRRVAIEYWSTQSSTQGPGVQRESIGRRGVDEDRIYISRVTTTRRSPLLAKRDQNKRSRDT